MSYKNPSRSVQSVDSPCSKTRILYEDSIVLSTHRYSRSIGLPLVHIMIRDPCPQRPRFGSKSINAISKMVISKMAMLVGKKCDQNDISFHLKKLKIPLHLKLIQYVKYKIMY